MWQLYFSGERLGPKRFVFHRTLHTALTGALCAVPTPCDFGVIFVGFPFDLRVCVSFVTRRIINNKNTKPASPRPLPASVIAATPFLFALAFIYRPEITKRVRYSNELIAQLLRRT